MRTLAVGIVTTITFAATMLISVAGHNDSKHWDTTAYYKGKCAGCHGHKAEKKFDSTHPDEQLIDAVLKGKKAAHPPNMPGYGAKGLTSEHAKNLVDYMKQLKAGQ
jgi:mono/diheme cytochrome c family protein